MAGLKRQTERDVTAPHRHDKHRYEIYILWHKFVQILNNGV